MKIVSRIRGLLLLAVASSTLLVLLIGYWSYQRLMNTLRIEAIENLVESESSRFQFALEEIARDAGMLHSLPLVGILANSESIIDSDLVKERLADTFFALLGSKPYYEQVRLIGCASEGRELVRVDRLEDSLSVVAEDQLQSKGHRNYFKECIRLPDGATYISPIDLNRERGEIELPYRPTFRMAMPVYDQKGQVFGIVVINVNFLKFARENLIGSKEGLDYYLANEAGDFLLHPDSTKTFGFDLGNRYRLQDEFPDVSSALSDNQGLATAKMGSPWDFHAKLLSLRSFVVEPGGRKLTLGILGSFESVSHLYRSILFKAIVASLLVLLFLLIGSWLVSRQLTRPIEMVSQAALRLGKGGADVELPIDRTDEIGYLAKQFTEMRNQLKEKERELLDLNYNLKEANKDLEHFSHIASHELREPLSRISGLAEIASLDLKSGRFEDVSNMTERLQQESKSALARLSGFRAFAELGRECPKKVDTDMAELVVSVTRQFSADLTARKIDVSYDELPTRSVFRELVFVLYRNLMENALKYSERDGIEIRFTFEKTSTGEIYGFSNTGSTIRSSNTEQVFQPYVRLVDGTGGTGLGLAICKRIVERHEGRIWVEALEDCTHFRFTLESTGAVPNQGS